MKFTIEEIKNYLNKQDSLGDIHYNLSVDNIVKANLPTLFYCTSCGKESIEEEDFDNDLSNDIDEDELTCEECYDEM